MPITFQQKILRVVEYGTFTRVGGSEEIRVNTRIIAATNVRSESADERGEFSAGSLRPGSALKSSICLRCENREGDIAILARHFLGSHGRNPRAAGKETEQIRH